MVAVSPLNGSNVTMGWHALEMSLKIIGMLHLHWKKALFVASLLIPHFPSIFVETFVCLSLI